MCPYLHSTHVTRAAVTRVTAHLEYIAWHASPPLCLSTHALRGAEDTRVFVTRGLDTLGEETRVVETRVGVEV